MPSNVDPQEKAKARQQRFYRERGITVAPEFKGKGKVVQTRSILFHREAVRRRKARHRSAEQRGAARTATSTTDNEQ